ncbi:gamma carbonic anhydrase family protein [Stakelama sediminis]|uniref:Carbonic anhydrase/acetyltransferase-like protein (Isoleucine patch superfamily) n=1 Tax=Stakelama sediminis TaxID=463200 RepID=A0A840YU36_9SPHN|nr:gamma carbonic anhydrase family protein [Stakelama sediminis]MBB5717116.1 carbonic anhydrase/acetyltransferase-like protein (isoleucine patch superfamily) [Stakelama sediminis]
MARYEIDGKRPSLAEGAWAAPTADLIGDVRLAEQASVWFGAIIRGDNTPMRIGARSNFQDGAVGHSDADAPLTIGEDCTIGHKAILHGCTLGNRVLVGMGATILNHAVIPDDCIVGAGALVTEGKTFEPGSLILGSPARAIRKLDDASLAGLRWSAAHYVEKAAKFATGLIRID